MGTGVRQLGWLLAFLMISTETAADPLAESRAADAAATPPVVDLAAGDDLGLLVFRRELGFETSQPSATPAARTLRETREPRLLLLEFLRRYGPGEVRPPR